MTARNYQDLGPDAFATPSETARKLNDNFGDINGRIDNLEKGMRVDVQVVDWATRGAVTDFAPHRVSFAFSPKAVVIARAFVPAAALTTQETVNGIDWVPEAGTSIQIRAISGVAINTHYQLTLVAYG